MDRATDFLFNRTLTRDELNFWSSFCDHFPFHHNQSIQFIAGSFDRDSSHDIVDYYEKIKLFKTKDELNDLIEKDAFPPFNKFAYFKVIEDYDKIFPNSKPVELFLMSLYGSSIQEWDLEITEKGINILPGDKSVDQLNHALQLTMITDFMNERVSHIFPHLKLDPILISGEKIFVDEKNDNKNYLFKIEENGFVKQFKQDDNHSFIYQFSYTFTENLDHSQQIYSPFRNEQSKLIKTIQKHFLENELNQNETKQKTRKI